jgi:hypothetical protein
LVFYALHRRLGGPMGKYLGRILLIMQVFENMKDLAFARLAFSEKSGNMNYTFYWKDAQVAQPFNTVYTGGPDTKPPPGGAPPRPLKNGRCCLCHLP